LRNADFGLIVSLQPWGFALQASLTATTQQVELRHHRSHSAWDFAFKLRWLRLQLRPDKSGYDSTRRPDRSLCLL